MVITAVAISGAKIKIFLNLCLTSSERQQNNWKVIKWRRNIFLYLTECFRRAVCFVGGNDIIKICYGYLERANFCLRHKVLEEMSCFLYWREVIFSCCLLFRNKFGMSGFHFTSVEICCMIYYDFVKGKSTRVITRFFFLLLKSIIIYSNVFLEHHEHYLELLWSSRQDKIILLNMKCIKLYEINYAYIGNYFIGQCYKVVLL